MSDDFMRICPLDEIVEGSVQSRTVDGRMILLARDNDGVYALDDVCTHDGGELGAGDLVNGQVQCPRHGARFDLKTGAATRMPAVIGIRTHVVKIEDGEVYVKIAD